MDKLYIFPLINVVLIPGNIVGLIVNDEKLVSNLANNMKFIASLVKDQTKIDFYNYGCLCEIMAIQKIADQTYIVQLKASKRVKLEKIKFEEIYPFTDEYKILEDQTYEENEEIKQNLIKISQKYVPLLNNEQTLESIKNKPLCLLTDIIVSLMKLNPKLKQQFLEETNCLNRANKIIDIIEDITQRWPGKIVTLKSFLPKPLTTTIYLS
ncbi:MAG: LON peptidase substrate-binding domain-containing protein [bacterium]